MVHHPKTADIMRVLSEPNYRVTIDDSSGKRRVTGRLLQVEASPFELHPDLADEFRGRAVIWLNTRYPGEWNVHWPVDDMVVGNVVELSGAKGKATFSGATAPVKTPLPWGPTHYEKNPPIVLRASELRYNDRLGPWRIVSDPVLDGKTVTVATPRGEQTFGRDDEVEIYR